MKFVNPWMLVLVALVPLAGAFWTFLRARAERRLEALVAPALKDRLLPRSPHLFAVQALLLLMGLALVLFAAARPQWGHSEQKVQAKSRNVVVALDVSRSMLAEDVRPNRLERAKADVADLVESLEGDRCALVAFRRTGELLCPLTTDRGFLRAALESATPESAARGETDLGAAIRKSLEALDPAADDHNAIILISDGGDLRGGVPFSRPLRRRPHPPHRHGGLGSLTLHHPPPPAYSISKRRELAADFPSAAHGSLLVVLPAELRAGLGLALARLAALRLALADSVRRRFRFCGRSGFRPFGFRGLALRSRHGSARLAFAKKRGMLGAIRAAALRLALARRPLLGRGLAWALGDFRYRLRRFHRLGFRPRAPPRTRGRSFRLGRSFVPLDATWCASRSFAFACRGSFRLRGAAVLPAELATWRSLPLALRSLLGRRRALRRKRHRGHKADRRHHQHLFHFVSPVWLKSLLPPHSHRASCPSRHVLYHVWQFSS